MLTLDWPPSILSPNNRSHWARKAKVKAKFRSDCFYLAKSIPLPLFVDGNISVTIVFNPPTKRKYDIDNLLASMKSGLDGVADAWGVNDTRFRPITIDFGAIVKGGNVNVFISQKDFK